MPAERLANIKSICTDLWQAYITATQKQLPQTTIVAHRFHVARLYRESVDRLRKQTIRLLRSSDDAALQEGLRATPWPFRPLKKFGLDLIGKGQQLQFNGKDLSSLFIESCPR